MQDQMQSRLEGLRNEFKTGQAEHEKIEQRQAYQREMLLRISGAIQVLEELLAQDPIVGQNGSLAEEAQGAYMFTDDVDILQTKNNNGHTTIN